MLTPLSNGPIEGPLTPPLSPEDGIAQMLEPETVIGMGLFVLGKRLTVLDQACIPLQHSTDRAD